MISVKAQHKSARMSARKMRPLRAVVRSLPVTEAQAQLKFMPGKGAAIIAKVLNSAIANAKHNHEIETEDLQVADVIIDESFTMKRFQPRSRGMAHPIKKRTCHVTVVLEGKEATKAKTKKAKKTEIETITADQHFAEKAEETKEDVTPEDEKDTGAKAVEPEAADKAHQKKKMQQQGGDKTKTHRRKSM